MTLNEFEAWLNRLACFESSYVDSITRQGWIVFLNGEDVTFSLIA